MLPSPRAAGLLALVALSAACAGSPTTPVRGTGPAPGAATVAASSAEPSSTNGEPKPPVAQVRPHEVPSPSGSRNDPYHWIRDDTRKDPAVLAYLTAENDYTARILAPVKATTQTLFAEMRSRLKEDDASVPTFDEGYWYYTRFETGKQQPIYARRKGKMTANEEILLDGNQLAEGHAFYQIGATRVSRNGRLLAWADDSVGRNQYTLHFKDLATGTVLPDRATNMAPSMAWANDNKTLFFTGKDEVSLREDRVFRHTLGENKDELVFREEDGSYYVGVENTKSKKYVTIELEATTNTEVRLIDANKPSSAPVVFLPRSKDHEYQVEHLDGRFWIRTNADAKNFRLVSVAEGVQSDRNAWKDVIAANPAVLLEDFAVYHGFVAATVRSGGLQRVEVLPKGKPAYFLEADDPTYAMSVLDTPDPIARSVRYAYDSMVLPRSEFELDVGTKKKALLKQQPVPGYDANQYTSEYLHAAAADGALIPISVVYKKTTPRDGTAPLLIDGYGSYGMSTEPAMWSHVVSLLDRGWVFALAHVRGGQEMGRAWYEAGKLMNKKNTFTDFIAVTEHLSANKYGARDQLYAEGGSAGGLLMGAVLNLRPDLYRGVVAEVPFVDVVTTMLDETIPLTTNEFDEWGDPKQKAAYDYMLSYSPYDNVKAQAYPSVYVRAGLWDSQVQYYEPTKWVAKLRATKTDQNLIVLDTDMTSGHGGASGRFDRLEQVARAMAFLLYVRERPDRRAGWPN